MNSNVQVVEVDALKANWLQSLSHLLIAVVDDGASIGFLPPLSEEEATAYWEGVKSPGVTLWVALDENETILGTVQLQAALKANGLHRAEIAKLMVHPEARRRGIAQALMEAAEQKAAAMERSLLVLDTRAGDPSNLLYQSRGFIEAGRIPDYAKSASGELHTTVFYYKRLA